MVRILCLSLLVAAGLSLVGLPASASEGIGRIPTVTRLVKLFLDKESSLIEAIDNQDKKAVSKLLADDFEMRVGAIPGNPVPRAAWIRKSFTEAKSSSTLEQMAVHDYGKTAVVSFSRLIKGADSEQERTIFIVDIWTQAAGDWVLSARYAGPAGADASGIPGAVITTPAFEKKE